MTAAKLLEVMSRKSQHLLIDRLSHPDVGCSWMAVRSRFFSWKSLNWMRVRKSSGWVKRSLSRLSDELIFFLLSGGKVGEEEVMRSFSYDFSALQTCPDSASITVAGGYSDPSENVGRPAQSTPAYPANGGEKDSSKVSPGSRLPVPGRLPGKTRLGPDAGRQHDHRPAPETCRRSNTGAGDEKAKVRYGKRFFISVHPIQVH